MSLSVTLFFPPSYNIFHFFPPVMLSSRDYLYHYHIYKIGTKIWHRSSKIAVGKVFSNKIRVSDQGRVFWLDVSGCTERITNLLLRDAFMSTRPEMSKIYECSCDIMCKKPHHWWSFLYYKKLVNNNKGKCQVCFCLPRTLGLSKIGVTIA